MTNTRPTFRPTAASFSAATQSPTCPSSTNDLPFLPEGSHDAECEIQLHTERLCDIRHIGGGPALEKPKDRGACFRLGRSEERRVGKECRLTCRSRWSPYH